MSIFGAMHTSVSGMNAQSNRLSTLSNNIANADTVGDKSAGAQFETVLANDIGSSSVSGGVITRTRYNVAQQGLVQGTTAATNLAVQGQGFFVVADGNGAPLLTRAGAFVPDADGHLVNTAGFKLMGVDLFAGDTSVAGSGFGGLTQVTLDPSGLAAGASTRGTLAANLPATAGAVAAADLPSANSATARFTDKPSLVAYDTLGGKVPLDVFLTKTGANSWEAAIYNAADAASGGGFPYSSGPLANAALAFDPATGALASGSASSVTVVVPGGKGISIDLSRSTQLASDFSVATATTDGSAPSPFSKVQVDGNGIVSAVFQNGTTIPKFRIVLASVPAPDQLTPESGNVYALSSTSGAASVGAAGSGVRGEIITSALEASTVDIASELTDMIETQRAYTANSKAFQIGTDMADVFVNLKV